MGPALRSFSRAMIGYLARIVVVAGLAAFLAAPAAHLVRVQGAERDDSRAAPQSQATPSPTAEATTVPTASPERTFTPSPPVAPTAKPTATATAKPTGTPTKKPEPTAAGDQLWGKVVWACLAEAGADEPACFRALGATGISLDDLRVRTLARLDQLASHHAERAELEILVQKCVASQGIESATCMRAWGLSGLSLEDFRAVVLKKMRSEKSQGAKTSELETWLRKCIDSRELYGADCYRAWELSGLSSEDFDRKIRSAWESRR